VARERWFLAEGALRRGPWPLEQLVDTLRSRADPRAALVWHRGFAGWTRVENVPELAVRVGALLERPEAEWPPGEPAVLGVDRQRAPAPRRTRRHLLLYAGLTVALGFAGWRFRPARAAPAPLETRAETAPEGAIPTASVTAARSAVQASPAATSPRARRHATPPPVSEATAAPAPEHEAELPVSERRQLRAVAAWSADRLELTVRNGSGWRVTALRVRVYRLAGEEFVEDARPVTLLPSEGSSAAGTVEPGDRPPPASPPPGLEPLSTGPFVGQAGAPPEGFRFEIESARGYPPRR